MPGPFGQPQPQVDLGADIGMGYQQNAANKIAQARVDQRKGYTSGYAKKYGITDVSAAVKGKSDTDIYEMAANLVQKRRGHAAGPAPAPAGGGPKPAPKPATKPAAPKVTAKSPSKTTAKRATTTTRRPRRRRTTTTATRTATAPTISTATRALVTSTKAGLLL